MNNIPPFQRHQYDVIKAKYADGVYKYDLVDKFTRQPVKFNSNPISTQTAIEMFSQGGAGQQVHDVNVGDSFGFPGVSNTVGSTGQGAGATGDVAPQTTSGGLDTNLTTGGASG